MNESSFKYFIKHVVGMRENALLETYLAWLGLIQD